MKPVMYEKYLWNPKVLRHTQDSTSNGFSWKVSLESWDTFGIRRIIPGFHQPLDPLGKLSLESWDTLAYSGLSQDSTSH